MDSGQHAERGSWLFTKTGSTAAFAGKTYISGILNKEKMLGSEQRSESKPGLREREYRDFVRAAESYREEFLVRLAGEVGVGAAEMTRLRPEHVSRHEHGDNEHYFLAVPGDGDKAGRLAYLPGEIEQEIRQYVRERDIDDDERIVPVTPRRVQMLVSAVGDRAADRTGHDRYREVSTQTLRQYFARWLLSEEGMHPGVVMAIGGWQRLESLTPYLETPDIDDIAAAFEGTSVNGRDDDERDTAAFRRAVELSEQAVYVTDRDGVVEYVNPQFETLTGYAAAEAIGNPPPVRRVDDAEAPFAPAQKALARGRVWEEEVAVQRRDGKSVRGRQIVAPVSTDGAAERFVATVVTETRANEQSTAGEPTDRLDDVLACLQSIHEVTSTASTREEIERLTCERLAASEAYQFAWFGTLTGEQLTVRASAGIDGETIETHASADGASALARRSGEVCVGESIQDGADGFEDWSDHASDAGYRSMAAIPVRNRGTTEGVLHVSTADPIGERERTLLDELGVHLGQAVTVARQERLLLADTVVELEFQSTDPDSFFVEATTANECTFTLEGIVPGEEQALVYFVTLDGAAADDVLRWAEESTALADARLVREYSDEALLEFVLDGTDCSKLLVKRGATINEMSATEGVQHLTVEIPSDEHVREITSVLTTVFPDTEFLSKRELERPTETATDFRETLGEELTDKQTAVLQGAYHAGYFEWPRGSTGEELADAIGITSPTLHNHLRRAQQKLLDVFFEEGMPESRPEWTR